MSLGLFNCRLIQPAGDQLFFFVGCLAAPLPVRASSVQSPCDPSCSAPTNGRAQNASCLSFSESSCFGFRRGRSPVGCRRVHSHRFTREFPRRSPILPTDSAIEPQFGNNRDRNGNIRLALTCAISSSSPFCARGVIQSVGVFSKPSQKDRLRREKGHAERRSSSLGAVGAKVNRIEVRPEIGR